MSAVNKKLPTWEFIFICLCTVYFIVPTVHVLFPFYLILFVEIIYSLYLILTGKVSCRMLGKMALVILCLALFYTFLSDSASIDVFVSNRLLKRFISKLVQYSCMFFPLLFLKRIVETDSRKRAIFIILLSIVAYIYASIPILRLIAVNPLAARDFGLEEAGNFIAPYPFVYGMTFVVVGSFICLLNAKQGSHVFKWVSLGVFIFSLYFLYKSQFTLSVITSFITVIIIITNKLRSSGVRLVFLLTIVILLVLTPFILDYFVIPYVPSMLASRFIEVRDFFLGNLHVESDMYGRFELYWRTIQAFISSPIIGNRTLDFDGHATYLMVWAQLGIFGGLCVFYLLFRAKSIVSYLLNDISYLYLPVFIHLLLNGFTNPIHASLQIYICVWFLVPLAICTLKCYLSVRRNTRDYVQV